MKMKIHGKDFVNYVTASKKTSDAFRGQNILDTVHTQDDVVEYFVQKSAANGIDIIRILTGLNDLRNLQTVSAANKEKAHAQVALFPHIGEMLGTLEYWTDIAKRIEDMGADLHLYQRYGRSSPSKQSYRELVASIKRNS